MTTIRLTKARYGSWRQPLGRFAIPTATDPQRPQIRFNRYPGKIIGVTFCPGGRRYLSWVWPMWVVGLRLTSEQFGRQVRELTDESRS
jgi:hypothetical protein